MKLHPVSAVIFCVGLIAPTLAGSELLAGVAKRSIVPPFPTHMGGFGDRTQTFDGVHDELFARALTLDDGSTQVIVVGSDLMAIDVDLVRLSRAAIEEKTGVPAENIMISCTHNHSAPSYYQNVRAGEAHPPLEGFLVEQFTAAAVEAFEKRAPAEVGYRAGAISDATSNRQQGNTEVIDPTVGVIRVEEKEGRDIVGVLYNFTGHPVILGSRNLKLSAEYPGAASRAVEKALGGVAIFLQGACGDITVRRSGDPLLEVERLGRLVAGEVVKTAEHIRPSDDISIAVDATTLNFEVLTAPPKDESQAAMRRIEDRLARLERNDDANGELKRALEQELRMHRTFVRRAEATSPMFAAESYDAEVQVMTIGDTAIVAMPGEIFVEYALELRQRVRQLFDNNLIFAGYANGYVGYVVTPRAVATGGYEASVARVEPGAGRQMTEAAMDLLTELYLRD